MSNQQVWRLIPFLEASGSVQMAIDRWLLQQHLSGNYPSTLRFYTWSPPAISLGYHQKQYPQHWENLTWKGQTLDLVRRPTGGRAVLHQGDLTYTVVTSGLVGSRLENYHQICEFLVQGWRSLNVQLNYGTAGRGYIHNPNCFATATGADLVLPNGAKFIGSAQLIKGGAILQHGSMRLQPDAELFAQAFDTESFQAVELPSNLSIDKITTALIAALRDCFNVEISVKPLCLAEWDEILGLE